MRYKAVIIDLDGTAVDSPQQKIASGRLTQAISGLEQRGIKVCAATGRCELFAMPVLSSTGLVQPAIVSAGTRIINPKTEQELWRCGLSDQQVSQVIDIFKTLDFGFLWNDYTDDDYLNGGWPIADFDKQSDEIYFLQVVFVPHDQSVQVAERLLSVLDIAVTMVVAQRPGYNDLHITHKVATKEHAIYELEKMIGVPKDQMIGVGDGHNDLHLFAAVGHKVAMGNAVDELKNAADEIIGSVQNEGLAEYFEKLAQELDTQEATS